MKGYAVNNKILVVDDEESIRYTFESFLTDEGYTVITAGSYDDAVKHINEHSFDLIFTDIILGGKTGIDLLQKVNELNIGCHVIVITGFPNIETASSAIKLGAFDYIFKPVRQETLIHTARMAMNHKSLQDENKKYRSNLEAIFRSVKDAIITVNTDMEIMDANKAAKDICGITSAHINKRIDTILTGCNGKYLEAVKKTISGKKPVEIYRTECSDKDMITQIITINTSPLTEINGNFYGAVMVVRDETRLTQLEQNLNERQQFHKIIGQSMQMQKIYSLIEDLSDVQTTVLITGESGTGKELIANAIHFKGSRINFPMVKVNCSALSENLLESELFGHVKGAFTGADKNRAGRFQKADGGTIFLDEIGDISTRMQLRLLRVLQEKEFEQVGDSTPIKVDVRIIAATNQDLRKKVRLGEFREDLYYRLKVMEISLPPLRERKEDILLLSEHFLEKFNARFHKNITALSDDVKKAFMDYSWPGNIREMEHTIEHAFVTAKQHTITIENLPDTLVNITNSGTDLIKKEELLGRQNILDALRKSGWNKSKAARLLGINVRTIYRKIGQYDLQEDKFSHKP